ncbi:MAG: hypothetical protein E6I38_13215 [Chloroflexi bacterium]|nr:MAG: hypothetical protein E6I38_13215 [Chloroflexota bacterium]TMG01877.1 MAG: hypothetical protein E6I03_07435 [Chloroflexota bacterium]
MSGKALGSAPARHDEATTLLYRLGFRGRSTLLKLAAVIAIEVVIVFGYVGHGAIDHYALHPMIAMASALPLFLLVRTLGFRLREELLISYFFLNFARFPDYLFEAGIEHQTWMNVFLLHLAFDEIIGWALVFLTVQVLVLGVAYVLMKLRDSRAQATSA